MRVDIEKCYERCRAIQIANGLDNTEYTVHHLVGQEQSFMDCLIEYQNLDPYFKSYFRGEYILNSFGGNILKKGTSYASNIHREIRSFSGSLPLMLNTLLFLDDFTHENGATWLMHRGHIQSDKPTDEDFMKSAFQVTGRAGSIAVWNSNLWHKAGVNRTDKPRRSVTPEFTRPFMKQGYDYSQFVKEDTSEYLKQVLGYNSRTPATLDQWYKKPEDRYYKEGQG
jgi:ectoine hydroxylase-related dioxygenase (phytanoyl-CoA dioxygenase family)